MLGLGILTPALPAGALTLGEKGHPAAAGVLLSQEQRDNLPQSSRVWPVEQFDTQPWGSRFRLASRSALQPLGDAAVLLPPQTPELRSPGQVPDDSFMHSCAAHSQKIHIKDGEKDGKRRIGCLISLSGKLGVWQRLGHTSSTLSGLTFLSGKGRLWHSISASQRRQRACLRYKHFPTREN